MKYYPQKLFIFLVIFLAFFTAVVPEAYATNVAGTFRQTYFWWRDDDGSETTATWKAATNAEIMDIATNAQIRLRIGTTEGGTCQGTGCRVKPQLEFSSDATSCTTGTWTTITTSTSGWLMYNSSNFADSDVTTQQISSETFAAGNMHDVTNPDAANTTMTINGATEDEWTVGGNSPAAGTVYYFRATNNGTAYNTYTVCAKLTTAAASSISQVAYRWFTNTNSVSAGTATPINTAITATTTDSQLRLRLLLHVADGQLGQSGTTSKLQYAERSGTCDTSFSGESFVDITTGSAIRYLNNSVPADNTVLTVNPQDPRHASSTGTGASDAVVNQTYNDGDADNTFSNSVAAIPAGQDGLWDFSLTFATVTSGTYYCFRAVQNGGGQLSSYSVVPELRTAGVDRVRLRGQIRLRTVRLR